MGIIFTYGGQREGYSVFLINEEKEANS